MRERGKPSLEWLSAATAPAPRCKEGERLAAAEPFQDKAEIRGGKREEEGIVEEESVARDEGIVGEGAAAG